MYQHSGLKAVLPLLTLIIVNGCASLTATNDATQGTSFAKRVAEMRKTVTKPWKGLTSKGRSDEPPRWDWASAIPKDVPRAEVFSATAPAEAVAHFVPQTQKHQVVLASTGHVRPALHISDIDGQKIRNTAELHAVTERAVEKGEPIHIEFLPEGASPNARAIPAQVDPVTLVALNQAASPGHPIMRVNEDGNPWIVYRQDGVRCKMMCRVERSQGLLHLVLSLGVCWGADVVLPADVRATCDGQPLQCLTAANSLEWLYGQQKPEGQSPGIFSFAAVSEQDDYLIPTNYQRLQEELSEATRFAMTPAQPALAGVPGMVYPGPAVLGDARALSAFLLQKQRYRSGDKEQAGWILFAGDALRNGGTIDVDVDLGHGPIQFHFTVPSR